MRRAFADLRRFGARVALVGGLAVSVHTRPRMTKDVDISVAVDGDTEAEQIVRACLQAGYRHGAILEHESGRLATARLFVPGSRGGGAPDLDLLFATCGIENEIVAGSCVLDLAALGTVPVANVGHLIAMELLSESEVRLQDRSDLQALIRVASSREIELAKAGAKLIEQRGFARGKRLLDVLAGFLVRQRGA
ncbi:MAG: hypothetical protein IPK26_26760 [Planctomycetes bacterium]|nr:hypothetical protein [Planctomycetota bacterium]